MLGVLICIHEWWVLWINVDSEGHFCETLFSWQVYFTLRVFVRSLLRGNSRRNIFQISFLNCWPGIRTQVFATNKPPCKYYFATNKKNLAIDRKWSALLGGYIDFFSIGFKTFLCSTAAKQKCFVYSTYIYTCMYVWLRIF